MDKKIAVITPVYNSENYIDKCLETVKNQTYSNLTHYVYDDASCDGTVDVINNYSGHDVCLIQSNKNRGQSFARNTLIAAALADNCSYVAFLDSDDWWSATHLEENLVFLNKANLVFSTPQCISETGVSLWPTFFIPDEFSGVHLNKGNYIWISSVLADIKCFVDHKFITEFNSIEDWDMWLQLYHSGFKLIKQPTPTSFYLIRPVSEKNRGHSIVSKIYEKYKHLNEHETQ